MNSVQSAVFQPLKPDTSGSQNGMLYLIRGTRNGPFLLKELQLQTGLQTGSMHSGGAS